MKVDVGAVLSRAYQTVIKHRVLWALGFFVAILSGTGSSFQYREEGQIRLFDVEMTPSPEVVILLITVALLLAIALFLVRAAFDAGLIMAGDLSANNSPPTFGEAWKAGRAAMWPVLGLNLIFAGLMLLLVLGLALAGGLAVGGLIVSGLFNMDAGSNLEVAWRSVAVVGVGAIAVLGLLLAFGILAIALGLTMQVGQRAAVLDHQTIGQAWSTGWRLMREHLLSSIGLLLVQLLVNVGVGIVTLVVLSPFVAIVAAAVVGGAEIGAMLIWLLPLLVVAWAVAAIVKALPSAWNSLVWTLFYRAATVGLPISPDQAQHTGRQLPPPMPGVYGG